MPKVYLAAHMISLLQYGLTFDPLSRGEPRRRFKPSPQRLEGLDDFPSVSDPACHDCHLCSRHVLAFPMPHPAG
jgi:hypothetical protein